MEISDIKMYLKAKKITYAELSKMSGVPLQTLQKIFAGITPNPRIDTMQAIEKALGIAEQEPPSQPALSDNEERLLNAFNSLIPPMQDYVVEMIERLVAQPQNVRRNTGT